MSTTPDALLETTAAALETTLAATEAAVTEATAAAEELLDIESIKAMLDGFDPAGLLPDLSKVFDSLAPLCRFAVLIGPVVLLILGLSYLILSPKEANHYLGYRCYFGMGSEYAWRFTQRLAGFLFTGTGLVLTAVMFVIAGGFASLALSDMALRAAACLLAELAAAVLLILTVNLTAALRFDRKGNHRRKRR
jgi:hypothetical protein